MGAIAPNPYYNDALASVCMEKIFIPTVRAMQDEGCPFKGCLYFGLMLTKDGPKVIEYNCRFGDPETQVVLPLLESDLFSIMRACTEGNLKNEMVRFSYDAACCVVLASGGYPAKYETGFEITGIADAQKCGSEIYCAGVKLDAGASSTEQKLLTAGGRVLGVTSVAPNLRQAIQKSYKAAEKIQFKNMHYRKDIGSKVIDATKN
jgi:phosphoribosylamine--glycine ligase